MRFYLYTLNCGTEMNVNGPKMCNLHISPSSPPSTQIFILLLVRDALKFYRAMDKKEKKVF